MLRQDGAATFNRAAKCWTGIARLYTARQYLHNLVPSPGANFFIDAAISEYDCPVLEQGDEYEDAGMRFRVMKPVSGKRG